MPPICTTDISGTAAKLNTSPASVSREKNSGPRGSSATSAAADAANSPTAGRTSRGPPTEATTRGTPITMAIVAPNVSRKPASSSASGLAARMTAAAIARALPADAR
jgi:hypothetical protein